MFTLNKSSVKEKKREALFFLKKIVENNDIELLSKNIVDPSLFDNFAIRMACKKGCVELVKFLLADERVDPSVQKQACLRAAVGKGFVEIVKPLLLNSNVDPSEREYVVLHNAIKNDDYEMVNLLLSDRRIELNAKYNDLMKSAFIFGGVKIVNLLLNNSKFSVSNVELLIDLIKFGKVENVRLLLEREQISEKKYLNLFLVNAVESGNIKMLDLLLEQGATIEFYALEELILRASFKGVLNIVEFLLEEIPSGETINIINAIYFAALNNEEKVVSVLLKSPKLSFLSPLNSLSNQRKYKVEDIIGAAMMNENIKMIKEMYGDCRFREALSVQRFLYLVSVSGSLELVKFAISFIERNDVPDKLYESIIVAESKNHKEVSNFLFNIHYIREGLKLNSKNIYNNLMKESIKSKMCFF